MALTEEQQRLNEEAIQNTIDEWSQNQMSDKIKGLAEKNESFKGMTSPDRIDAQIENGVDFFDDVEGGATGFTPKTDLESLYNQAQGATFGPVEGEVDYYADLNPPSVSTIFQPLPNEGGYLVSPPFPSPSTIEFNGPLTTLNIGNNVFDGTLRIPGADGSDFMVTPILNQPTSFSNPSDSLTLTVAKPDQPIENFNNDLRIPDANGSDFMVTPILNQPTSFSNPSDSLTLRIQRPNLPIEEFSNDIRIPNANNSVDSLSKLTLSNNFGIPGDRQPSISSEGHPLGGVLDGTVTIVPLENNLDLYSTLKYPYPLSEGANLRDYGTDFESTWPTAAPSNVRRRGPYDHFLASPFKNVTTIPIFDESNPPQITDPSRYFNEAETGDDSKLMGSIHISPGGEIKFGHRNNPTPLNSKYSGVFGSSVKDNEDSKWPEAAPSNLNGTAINRIPSTGYTEKSYLEGLTQFGSSHDTKGRVVGSETFVISKNTSTAPATSGFLDADYDLGDEDFTFENNFVSKLDNFKNDLESNNLILLAAGNDTDNIEGDTDSGFSIKNSLTLYGGGSDYPKVPAGLNENNKLSTKSFKEVADPDNLIRQPFILRDMGDNWGLDRFGDNPIAQMAAGFVRGAPGITGLIERSVVDKLRIFKFLTTSSGIAFLLKQGALQFLNPQANTRLYNPVSALSLSGGQDLLEALRNLNPFSFDPASALSSVLDGGVNLVASAILPIGHPERHLKLGGSTGRYMSGNYSATSINDFKRNGGKEMDPFGRLIYTSLTFGGTIGGEGGSPVPAIPESNVPIVGGLIDRIVNSAAERATDALRDFADTDEGKALIFAKSNPNFYGLGGLISSAPKSISVSGVPSFTGAQDLARTKVIRAKSGYSTHGYGYTSSDGTRRGGTFNDNSATSKVDVSSGIIQRYSTLTYKNLNKANSFESTLQSTFEKLEYVDGLSIQENWANTEKSKRKEAQRITKHIGDVTLAKTFLPSVSSAVGGLEGIKGDDISPNVDRINILPIFKAQNDEGNELPQLGEDQLKDFIKFMFKDVVNERYLVFRAILDGISDSVSPEFNDTRFIGRPDKVYTYAGTDRNISFNFKVYPKTKQELPVLMEKLNYLIGLCYPSYTESSRMITPFVELTLGDMFVKAPGILDSLTVTVEEATTWEIEEGLQFPHFISCQCEFKYIGKEDNIPVALGKHYDISWLRGNNRAGDSPTGTLKTKKLEDTNAFEIGNVERLKPSTDTIDNFDWITKTEESLTTQNSATG